ncbi:AmmeMemoRadiSam system protein B [Patescibacteria group bacterium]
MKRFKIVLGSFLVICVLSSCSVDSGEVFSDEEPGVLKNTVRGVVLPHHNLVGNYIDEFYSEIAEENVDRIILISTNHFDLGYHFIQSTYDLDSDLEFQTDFIEILYKENILSVEETGLDGEHGIIVHIDRIEKYFSEVQVVPIMIKWKTPQKKLDDLVEAILREGDMDRTLVIASIDFSHFVREETARANDERTMEWFENWENEEILELSLEEIWDLEKSIEMDTKEATALDSPETLYVFAKLMGDPEEVELWERTSSHFLYGGNDPMQNTSHLFVKVK